MSGDRFRDPLYRAECLTGEVLVRCPGCGACAVALSPGFQVTHRRLRCRACGLSKDAGPAARLTGRPVDPYFRLPLWLQADCRGNTLWAYNARHLDLLEAYVAARLRERGAIPGSMSMIERLPAWLKSAKHRDEILRLTRRLRASLPAQSSQMTMPVSPFRTLATPARTAEAARSGVNDAGS